MRKAAEYLGWVTVFIFATPLTPIGWLPGALDLQPVEWLAVLCGMGLVFGYSVCRGDSKKETAGHLPLADGGKDHP